MTDNRNIYLRTFTLSHKVWNVTDFYRKKRNIEKTSTQEFGLDYEIGGKIRNDNSSLALLYTSTNISVLEGNR